MSVVSSSIWARMSSISSARASGGSEDASPPDIVSRSMLVRSEVSGVRSSWLASATSCRWRTRDASSAVSIMVERGRQPGDLVVALDRERP